MYEPRGDYQIAVDALKLKGIGAQQLALKQLKSPFVAFYYSTTRKHGLFLFPLQIGAVTSLSGTAVWGVCALCTCCSPLAGVLLIYPVVSQDKVVGQHVAQASDSRAEHMWSPQVF